MGSINLEQNGGGSYVEYAARAVAMASREEYRFLEDDIAQICAFLEDPNTPREVIDAKIKELDDLYKKYAHNSSNSTIIEADQRVFRETTELISNRMRNQTHSTNGDITAEMFIDRIRDGSQKRQSGLAMLDKMSYEATKRGSMFAAPDHLPQFCNVRRRKITQRSRADEPTTEVVSPEDTDDFEFNYEIVQFKLSLRITRIVAALSEESDLPLSLYELCYNPDFTLCLENFFFVSVLIKENKLWIKPDEFGLPVVGINKRGANNNEEQGANEVRTQFNWNFNRSLHKRLNDMFHPKDADGQLDKSRVDEIILIPRDRAKELRAARVPRTESTQLS